MDATILFIVFLMFLAVQAGMAWLAAGLFIIGLVLSKNKYFIAATLVGGLVALLLYAGAGDSAAYLVAGGLFIAFILVMMQDPGTSGPQSYGMGPGY